MNFEIFLWLEPVAETLLCIASIVGLVVFLVGLAACAIMVINDGDDDVVAIAKRWVRGSIKICIVATVVMVAMTPLANFSDTYKRILIYRGVNAEVVGKAAATAERALELLDKKIDKELDALK